MKKILVTGANGFIGRYCLPFLVKQGFEVHGTSSKVLDYEVQDVKMHQVDLFDISKVESLIKDLRPSHLLHFAWVTAPGVFWSSPDNQRWVEASWRLLKNFQEQGGLRAVMSGTCAEYDWSSLEACSELNTPLNPMTLYGKSKKELYTRLQELDLSWAWGRIFHLYGPNEPPQKLISSMIVSLLKDKDALCTHGNQIRDFLHVQDVASAFAALMESPLEGAVNIASGRPVTLKSICSKIGKKMGAEERIIFGAIPTPQNDPPQLIADVKRIYNELQWKPSIDLESGLEQTIQWWKENLCTV